MAPTLVWRAGQINRSLAASAATGLTGPRRAGRVPRGKVGVSVILRAAGLLVLVVLLLAPVAGAADCQVTWGVHTMLVPSYFDPAETIIGTSFMVLYGLHDALVKPLPGKGVAPALAEAWTVSPDGLVYEFVLRKGVRFHHGEPVTAEDAKFSLERYRASPPGHSRSALPPSRPRMPAASASGSSSPGPTS